MKAAITLLLLASYSVAYSAESISHSHNGRVHSHPLPETGKNHTHNSGGGQNKTDDEFEWLNRSGWVTLQQVCNLKKHFNPEKYKNTDCRNYKMTPVTGKSMLSDWAGETLKVYYDRDKDNFTGNLQIRVTWTTGDSYNCGQVIEKYQSELKDFTHRSIKMKKCQ
jgi:hypothetical protein